MAKKKKSVRKSSKKQDEKKKSASTSFWRQSFAFLLVLVALFILLGGFGWGGILPVRLFELTAWIFGFSAYFAPVVIVHLAIVKFREENHVIPVGKLLGGIMVLVTMSAVFHVFTNQEKSAQFASDGMYGGQVGHLTNLAVLKALSTGTAFVVYMLAMVVSFLFTFSIAPQRFVRFIIDLFRRSDEDTDLAELKASSNSGKIAVQENVPVEHHGPRAEPKVAGFRAAAAKVAPAEDQAALTLKDDPNWKFPSLDLLNQKQDKADAGNVQANAEKIHETLGHFGIEVAMEGANIGPRVTQYTLRPPKGVKLSKIEALENNIALDLEAKTIRIEAPIPGKSVVGVEVPNLKSATVRLSSVLMSQEWKSIKNPLSFALGKDISGTAMTAALDKMPHLLIAGQTGSGKSVMVDTLLTSLLYHNSPSELKMILVDPKQVGLTPYDDIPHLLTPVITEPEKCISALKWAVAEMERRLRTLRDAGVVNIADYNAQEEDNMPYIVIVIDELSDLMSVAAKDVEGLIVRITQKARAAGIHMVVATQSPRVNVITGLIKANIPARIAFAVSQEVESRIILDESGADRLLGMGDMLLKSNDHPQPLRIQGSLITPEEIKKVTQFLRDQQEPSYDDEVVSMPVTLNGRGGVVVGDMDDETKSDIYKEAVRVVVNDGKASTSHLQRRLKIGYQRAANLIELMEEQGIIGPADGSRARPVLVSSPEEVFGVAQPAMAVASEDVYSDMPDDEPSDI